MFCRLLILIIIFLNLSPLCSQNKQEVVNFHDDKFLKFDTLFSNFKLIEPNIIKDSSFNEEVIKLRLDSLNQLTLLELTYNQTVLKFIKFYIKQRESQVAKLLALSDYYFPIFEEYLDKHSMPLELKYIPIIESSLRVDAKSPAGAVGIWQFMYYTAKEYNLRINSYLDERRDVYKSTEAACQYLNKAFNIFDNWELAVASYNCGRGNVTKALRRSGGELNYWKIRPFLPRETRNYIPALISVIYVMNYASEHGIKADTTYSIDAHTIDTIQLKKPIKIHHLAEVLQIEQSLIEELNPVYRNKLVPYRPGEKFHVVLPHYKWGVFLNNEDSIYSLLNKMEEAENLEYPLFSDIEKIKYIVKSGDYLGRIARKYKCKVSDIMTWNDLSSSKIRVGQKIYIYRTIK